MYIRDQQTSPADFNENLLPRNDVIWHLPKVTWTKWSNRICYDLAARLVRWLVSARPKMDLEHERVVYEGKTARAQKSIVKSEYVIGGGTNHAFKAVKRTMPNASSFSTKENPRSEIGFLLLRKGIQIRCHYTFENTKAGWNSIDLSCFPIMQLPKGNKKKSVKVKQTLGHPRMHTVKHHVHHETTCISAPRTLVSIVALLNDNRSIGKQFSRDLEIFWLAHGFYR